MHNPIYPKDFPHITLKTEYFLSRIYDTYPRYLYSTQLPFSSFLKHLSPDLPFLAHEVRDVDLMHSPVEFARSHALEPRDQVLESESFARGLRMVGRFEVDVDDVDVEVVVRWMVCVDFIVGQLD